jgi:tetratricopeptide (TPR) repeat protein
VKKWKHVITFSALVVVYFPSLVAVPCFAQYREYMAFGIIVDNNNDPIPKVVITLEDKSTSRKYQCKTDKKGKFKYAGLPHGIYKVTMEKEGYQTRTDEWDLNQKQYRMQRVDFHTIVMLSDRQFHDIEVGKKLQKGYKKAKELIGKKDYDGAIGILDGLLKEKPDEPPILYLLGASHLYKKSYDEAIPLFKKLTEIDPGFPGGYFQLGVCFQRKGEFEKALACYQSTLELESKNETCLYNSGLILYRLERTGEALMYFEKALAINDKDALLLEMAGLCHLRGENYDKALEYFEKAKVFARDPAKLKSLDELIKELKRTKKE